MDIYTLNEQIDDYEAFVKSKGLEEEFKEFKRSLPIKHVGG